MTGATGQLYGIKALKILSSGDIRTHLIISNAAKLNIQQEGDQTLEEIQSLADQVHGFQNIGAPMSSGSWDCEGMIITPCSMNTLAGIARGITGNLITRAADVMLKQRRRLLLMPREKPLNLIHLRNMVKVTEAGAVIFPPMPSFYRTPKNIDEMITETMVRAIKMFDFPDDQEPALQEWRGIQSEIDRR